MKQDVMYKCSEENDHSHQCFGKNTQSSVLIWLQLLFLNYRVHVQILLLDVFQYQSDGLDLFQCVNSVAHQVSNGKKFSFSGSS